MQNSYQYTIPKYSLMFFVCNFFILSVFIQCGTVGDNGPGGNLTERSLQDAQRLFLMSEVVQPVSVDPLISQDNIRFSKLVVDIVQGHDTLYHVIYIGTGETCLSTYLYV